MDIDAVLREVREAAILRDTAIEPAGSARLLSGACTVGGRSVRLQTRVGPELAWEVPEVVLLNRRRYGHLAHVNAAGVVCTGRREAMVPDLARPAEVVVAALTDAISELERSFTTCDRGAIVDEFEAYWRDHPGAIRVQGHVAPTGGPRRLWVQKKSKNNATPMVVADSLEAYTGFHPVRPTCEDGHGRGVFIPLRAGTRVLPPAPGEVWTETDLRDRFMPDVALAHQAAVKVLLEDFGRDEVVVFSLPRTTRGHVLFGAWFYGIHGAHPMGAEGHARRLVPLTFDRRDADYLRPRGGASIDLADHRILLAGCGAVGAHLAAELVRAGVGHLTLVDPDVLKPENIFRHDLGLLGLDRKNRTGGAVGKAEALTASLVARYPYISVVGLPRRIEDVVERDLTPVQGYDVILLATGNVGVECAVTRTLFERSVDIDIVHCWLDPYGVGLHALHARPNTPGCLRCLFTDPESGDLARNRATFVDPAAEVDLDLAGCGTRFTPFGSLSAVRCATLGTELVLDVLTRATVAPLLRSERGRSRALVEAGHATSPRYSLSEADRGLPFANPMCPVCRH